MDNSTQGLIVGTIVFIAVFALNMLKISNIMIALITVVIALVSIVVLRRIYR
ncbi:hypothetical protein [Companilactobacillus kimchiensis]|nr:hypothetical protein [Companilactobacillus kimchiensis]